jgi:hypothetical protein
MAALLLGAALALAQTPADEHAEHHPDGATPPAPVAAQSPAQGTNAPAMPQTQDNMQKMQELMTKIHASKDGAERKQLLQQHSKAMQEQMQTMRGMAKAKGAPPMGDGMMNQMMMNHQAMQGRMEMMEMMMGQMLQHQEVQQDSKPAR